MKRSNRLMLVLGVALAVVAFGGVLIFGSGGASGTPAQPTTVSVVTAAVDVPLGVALDSTMLAVVQKPEAEATDTYREPSVLVGKVVRRAIVAGAAFTAADFETGGATRPDVASNLEAGHVAMAVNVDPVSGVGSLIQTGDHVDVVLTIRQEDQKFPVTYSCSDSENAQLGLCQVPNEMLNHTSVKVLVQNVQVVGTVSTVPIDSTSNQQTVGDTLVLLSLTAQQVELVRFAQVDGNLVLTLRSPKDADAPDVKTTGTTLRKLVDDYGVLPPQVTNTILP